MEIEVIYKDFPTIETDRLFIRKLTMEDAEDMFDYASNDEVTKYVSWDTHRTIKDTKNFLSYVMDQYCQAKVAPLGVELKETGKLIGTVDFVWWKPDHRTAEIGYVISHRYWGKGICTEAAKALIDFGFNQMNLVRIQARCFVENIASAKVMEKCGMKYEGTLRKDLFSKGKHWDIKMYSILRDEYFYSNR